MTKGWTEERRRKQAETIRRTRPWEKSTGPKTSAGKKRSSQNALKHGDRAQDLKEYVKLLRLNREFVKLALQLQKQENETRSHEQTEEI